MPFFTPWTQAPDVLGAAEAGARLGLSKSEMLQQADEHAAQIALQRDEQIARQQEQDAARGQQNNEFSANLAQRQKENSAADLLRQQQLKQNDLLGTERFQNEGLKLQNQSDSLTAREALDDAKRQALENKQTFVNTGNGLFVQGADGTWSQVPNTAKPKDQQFQNVKTYVQPVAAQDADITPAWNGSWNPLNWGAGAHPEVTNSPAVLPVPGHFENKKVPITGSDDDNAADALTPSDATSGLPDFTGTPVGGGAPAATGGYKVGATYKGGMTYLGGDPNDQNSWKTSDSQ